MNARTLNAGTDTALSTNTATATGQRRLHLSLQKLMRLLTHHDNSIHGGIKAIACPTLHTPKVPRSIRLRSFTIIANNRYHLAQLRWYRLRRNPHRNGIPGWFHPLLRLGRLLANGTPTIMIGQLLEAMPMYRMTTWQFMTRGPT